MDDGIDNINRQIKQGEIVITTDEKILNDETEKQRYVDAMTSPTMKTILKIRQKLQEQNNKPKE